MATLPDPRRQTYTSEIAEKEHPAGVFRVITGHGGVRLRQTILRRSLMKVVRTGFEQRLVILRHRPGPMACGYGTDRALDLTHTLTSS